MNVDMKVLEALTIERDIPLDRLITAIEIAVKLAYNEMEGARPYAHAKLDRESGEIRIVVPTFGQMANTLVRLSMTFLDLVE